MNQLKISISLRKLSEYCDFGTNLRDRFVCGLRNDAMQKKKLLSVDKLTYDKALEIALAMESASKDVAELQAKQMQLVYIIKIKKYKKKTD